MNVTETVERAGDRDCRPAGPLSWIVIGAALALGTTQALVGLSSVHLFGDEYHSVRNLSLSYGELARTYDAFGSGLLLPLLQKACVDLFGPGLWSYRLPAILGSLGALGLVHPCARRLVGPAAAHIATLALALSPIHVFYSRYGRSYSIATLLGLVFVYALLRLRADAGPSPARRGWWLLAAVSGALVPYAHLYAVTLVLPVAAGFLLASLLPGSRRCTRALAGATVAAALGALALHLPALGTLSAFVDEKAFARSEDLFGLSDVALLLYGSRAAGLAAIVGVPLAALWLARRAPQRALPLAFAAIVPAACLFLTRPLGLPYAYARYILVSLPFQLMALSWLVVAAARWLPRWSEPLGLLGGWALVGLLWLVGPTGPGRAAGGPFANSNLSLMPLPAFDAPWPRAPEVYDLLARSKNAHTIIEAPELWNRSGLLYRNHWLRHGKDVRIGFVLETDPLRIPAGFSVDLADTAAIRASGADYLVLHTNIYRELANYWEFVDETWAASRVPALAPLMAAHVNYGMATDRLDRVRAMAERLRGELGPPFYQDHIVTVWGL